MPGRRPKGVGRGGLGEKALWQCVGVSLRQLARMIGDADDVVLVVKGDRVEILIDTGGASRTYEVVATRAGRRVEVRTGRGLVEVSELTRGGTVVRTARFMAGRVLAVVEHPAADAVRPDDAAPPPLFAAS